MSNKDIKTDRDPFIDPTEEEELNARRDGKYNEIAAASQADGKCPFCPEPEHLVIERCEGWLLAANRFPRSSGDLLVMPERHIETVHDMSDIDILASFRLQMLGMQLLEEGMNIKAIYLLLREGRETDKTVHHIHFHVQNFRGPELVTWTPESLDTLVKPSQTTKILRETLLRYKDETS